MNVAPPGIPPLFAWDTRQNWHCHDWRGRVAWAQAHLRRADDTFRAEFHLIDAPFVVLYRYAENDRGHRFLDPATGEPAEENPVVQLLDELPPEHLRGA
jgi:hypothetical protein